MRDWVAFVSQTGGEVMNIYYNTNIKPLFIVTNHPERLSPDINKLFTVKAVPSKPSYSDYKNLGIPKSAIITLNGWLRVLPVRFVKQYEIYNGHPGLINKYPELKGLDPQKRAYQGGYKTVGSVIHRVVPEVDSGEIILYTQTDIGFMKGEVKEEDYLNILKHTSLECWIEFFKQKFV